PRRVLFEEIEQVLLRQPECGARGLFVEVARQRGAGARHRAPEVVVGAAFLLHSSRGTIALLRDARTAAAGAVHALVAERVRGIENALDRAHAMLFLALRNEAARERHVV